MENEVFENPIQVVKQVKDSKSKGSKKLKKSGLLKDSSQSMVTSSLENNRSMAESKKPYQIKSKDFIIFPSRIISLLIESKKSEAKAICQYRNLEKEKLIIEENFEQKEQYVRDLENEIYALRNNSSASKEFDTFGKTQTRNEINVVDEASQNISMDEQVQSLYERRVQELEKQIEHYRNKEQESSSQFVNFSKNKITDLRADGKVDGYNDNFHAMLDCLAVMSYEL